MKAYDPLCHSVVWTSSSDVAHQLSSWGGGQIVLFNPLHTTAKYSVHSIETDQVNPVPELVILKSPYNP